MSYVLVTADLPNVNSTDRTKIYACLKEKGWEKVKELERDISTVWHGDVGKVDEAQALEITKEHFISCSKPYCKPKLVMHFGSKKPTFVNFV